MENIGRKELLDQVFTYRGICEHGKVRMMIVDCPELKKEIAKELSLCIRRGLTVDRVTVEEARKSDLLCSPCDKKRRGAHRTK